MNNSELASAAATAPEVDLTTFGRKSGRPSRTTIWITTDAQGRIHIRSGQGLVRDWPQNLLANGRAILHIDGRDFAVRARHVTDRAELLASRDAVKAGADRHQALGQRSPRSISPPALRSPSSPPPRKVSRLSFRAVCWK
jgi:deazaflavin-dependent oxidoreductase (nitroreductase family)